MALDYIIKEVIMNTKTKGDIGELIIATELVKKGWSVSIPFGENNRYDLIIEKNGKIKRLQVKSVFSKNGVMNINCRSSNNWSVKSYTEKDFEILVAVDLSTNIVYYIDSKCLKKRLINLRIRPTKNNQQSKINNAKDYLEMPL